MHPPLVATGDRGTALWHAVRLPAGQWPRRRRRPAAGFQVGGRVIASRNRHHLGRLKRTRGTITLIDHDQRSVTRTVDGSGRSIIVPAVYDAGHLDHGYATTAHRARGQTVDATFTLGSEALYRELAYVAMPRSRDTNTMYTWPAPSWKAPSLLPRAGAGAGLVSLKG